MLLESMSGNWKDYDERKIKNGESPALFSCDEPWEIHYLKNKIYAEYPFISELKIFEAIEACSTKEPKQRNEFVQCVIKRLGLG